MPFKKKTCSVSLINEVEMWAMTYNMQMKTRHDGLYANGIQSQIFSFTVSHLFVDDTDLLFCHL